MWTILIIATAVFLIAVRIFLTAHNQTEVISAGLVAVACVMIALGVSPLSLKLALLASILLIEQWLLHRQPAAK